ncbi:MAG: DNA polymerase I [Campylobacter sp.]
MKKLTIIDTFGFFFRLYYALSSLKSKSGKPSGMISGFANFINSLKSEFPSDYIIFALDSKGKTFRSQISSQYKINRPTPPQALLDQLVICIEMIEKMGLCAISREGYEADDIIASIVKKYANDDIFISVITHDKDLYQLINDGKCGVYSPEKKRLFDSAGCFEKYGIAPSLVRDFLAISGDSADNIAGIKGIGDKGARDLLNTFGSLDKIYENLDKIANKRQKNLLESGRESAYISQKLATLYDDLKFEDDILKRAEFPSENPLLRVSEILREYSLNRLLKAIGADNFLFENETFSEPTTTEISPNSSEKIAQNLQFTPRLITDENELFDIINAISQDAKVAFDTETTGIEKDAKIVGFSFCFDENNGFYVPIAHEYLGAPKQISHSSAKRAIELLFSRFIIGQNLKFDFNVVARNLDIKPPKNYADTMILAWLDDPSSPVGMDALAKKFYNHETIKFEEIVKKGENFSFVALENAARYAGEDAWITRKFYMTLCEKLDANLLKLAHEIEFLFVEILLEMENNGILIDQQKMRDLIAKNAENLHVLSEEIYSLCGEKFNLNSPKQLGVILFEKLNLPCKKRTKSGYSTDESVLNELIDLHPVVEKLLKYREYFKLQSTYCEPLLQYAKNDPLGRIHSSFLQTGTATGRLSSKNPNLQNIPARNALANDIRECFIAQDGFSFISLDYSQIELRLLAHFSGDEALISAFCADEDIHAKTAKEIFGASDKDKRAIAKSINFGLIYGMGASKLAAQISVSRAQAKEYIERYFKAFPTILNFIDSIKRDTKNNGFVTTLFGRKRKFDFANASGMVLAMYERECVNTKFQGSAADIIKLAMCQIRPFLGADSRMILQIHDELVFEVRDEIADEFGVKIKEIMQNVVSLKIPLKTSLNIAKNLGDLK